MRNIKLERKFDCAICMFGGFGYLQSNEDLTKFFSELVKHFNKESLFIFEFWNIGGLKPTPNKSWMKTKDNDLILYRLLESNFNQENMILKIDYNFILIKNHEAQTFDETHRIRCYTIEEIKQILEQYKFKHLASYNWSAKNVTEPARRSTFKILVVSKRE